MRIRGGEEAARAREGRQGEGGAALRPWEEEERALGCRGRPAGGTRLSVSVIGRGRLAG
jgi:hypothetical protein